MHDRPHIVLLQEQTRVLRETSSGGAVMNDCLVHLSNSNLPFGGVGNSGLGSYHGHQSFKVFSHRKSVVVKTNYLDLPVRYPPYTQGLWHNFCFPFSHLLYLFPASLLLWLFFCFKKGKKSVLAVLANPALSLWFDRIVHHLTCRKNWVILALLYLLLRKQRRWKIRSIMHDAPPHKKNAQREAGRNTQLQQDAANSQRNWGGRTWTEKHRG